jgi:hypothetical protein
MVVIVGSILEASNVAATPRWSYPRGPLGGRVSWANATPRSLPTGVFASSAT